ncbi:alpha/beta hydrolase fold domain-containing protein [Pseudomonas sp. S32]|uniref:alpha/beta hydrolase n=1 Tax=Pseudomonas sp. S32 TaxID=2767448 RepID=UPI001913C5B4
MHGGGHIAGSALDRVNGLQRWAVELDCTIVSVEYKLGPEFTYADSIEDNYAALAWVRNNASALGIDPERIALVGESPGGGHAALLALLATERGEISIAYQVLIYPMLDDRTVLLQPPPGVGALLCPPSSIVPDGKLF